MTSSIGSDVYTSLQATVSPISTDEISKRLSGDSSANFAKNARLGLRNYAKMADSTSSTDNNDQGITSLHKKSDSADDEIKIIYGSKDDSEDDDDETYKSTTPIAINSFTSLAAAIGANNGKISKEQLVSYLDAIKSDNSGDYASKACEITLLKNLIAQFDTLSNDSGYITSLSGLKEAQDYTTVTKEQVTLPIDVRV